MAQQEKITIEVEERREFGKNANRRLRAAGKVPGNIYGLTSKPYAVMVDPRRVNEVLHLETGRNTIFSLALAGKEQRREVMLREIQRDPVSEQFVHIDFLRIDPDKKLDFDVPVRIHGTPFGVKNEGGILEFVHRSVKMSCLPHDVPDHVELDVEELHLGQSVHVRDLSLGADIEILDDLDMVLVHVIAPKVEAEEPEEAEAEGEEVAEATPEAGEAEAEKKED
jgi:large subunit ribosomal protein L25